MVARGDRRSIDSPGRWKRSRGAVAGEQVRLRPRSLKRLRHGRSRGGFEGEAFRKLDDEALVRSSDDCSLARDRQQRQQEGKKGVKPSLFPQCRTAIFHHRGF